MGEDYTTNLCIFPATSKTEMILNKHTKTQFLFKDLGAFSTKKSSGRKKDGYVLYI
jgi:hypothetical protein